MLPIVTKRLENLQIMSSDKNSFVKLLGLEGSIDEADSLADSLRDRLDGFDIRLRDRLEHILSGYLYRHHR